MRISYKFRSNLKLNTTLLCPFTHTSSLSDNANCKAMVRPTEIYAAARKLIFQSDNDLHNFYLFLEINKINDSIPLIFTIDSISLALDFTG